MKVKQKDTYKIESGNGFFLLVSKQYQKVKERYIYCLSAFPSIVTMKIDSFIKKPENINKFNQYIGTSIKNLFNRAEAVMAQFLPLFLYSQKKAVIYPEIKKKDTNEYGKSKTTI